MEQMSVSVTMEINNIKRLATLVQGVVMVMQYILDIANWKPIVVIAEDEDLLTECFLCQTKISKVNPKYGVYTLHVNSRRNVCVMGY